MKSSRFNPSTSIGLVVFLCGLGSFEGTGLAATQDTPSWAQLSPATSPGQREHVAMAYDSNAHLSVVFGGYDNAHGAYDDTWTWDGSTWVQASATGPAGRWSHSLAYDASRNVLVMFGGYNFGTGFLDETWEWNGATWTQACTTGPCSTTKPPARRDATLAYDATRHRVVLFGGSPNGAAALSDTWEWDGTSWTAMCTSGCTPPAGRWQSASAFTGDGVTVFGGVNGAGGDLADTWTWNGTAWTEKCTAAPCSSALPPARHDHAVAYDSRRGRLVVYGGYNGSTLGDTWEWDGSAWTQSAGTGPGGRFWHALAFDSQNGFVTLFGGTQGPDTGMAETWQYSSKGGACSVDGDCDTGHCVDGACCGTASCGTCEACNLATPGTCSAVTSAADPDTCTGVNTCDSAGACKKSIGSACSAAGDCGSNFCAQGVCCNAACTGSCESCGQAASLGTCSVLPAGSAGSPACAPQICNGTSTSCVDAPVDAGTDAGSDSGTDAGVDAGHDAGADAGTDSGAHADGGVTDAGTTGPGSGDAATSPRDASNTVPEDGSDAVVPEQDDSGCSVSHSQSRGTDWGSMMLMFGLPLIVARRRNRTRARDAEKSRR